MEFPSLGKHCHHGSCKQLDFLPIKCDACEEVFCPNHVRYDIHKCVSAYKKDIQVPVCPLCNKPVPVNRGEMPDIKVGEHIDRFCQSDPAVAKRRVYANRCSHKGCKRKELVPITCNSCRLNYCLRHRNELDHDCKGFEATGREISNTGAAAVSRSKQEKKSPPKSSSTKSKPVSSNPQQNHASSMSEDEALALALQISMQENSNLGAGGGATAVNGAASSSLSQEDEDRALALALHQSEQEYQQQHTSNSSQRRSADNNSNKKNCIVT